MASAPTIVRLPYNWSTDRGSAPIEAIVAHNTVGTDSRAYLSRGGDAPDGSDKKVSIHSLIRKDGILYRYVPDDRGANHAGFGVMPIGFPRINPNRCTIAFELENASDGRQRVDPYPDLQLLTCGWEINRIRAKYGFLPLIRHETLDPKRRKDTVGLTIAQMEAWATKAKVYFALPAPSPRPYRAVTCAPVFQDRRPDAPLALAITAGTIERIDDVTAGWAHLHSGAGFSPLSCWEPLL